MRSPYWNACWASCVVLCLVHQATAATSFGIQAGPAAATRPAVVKRALLVGINDYSASTIARSAIRNPRGINNLRGAVMDVETAATLLAGRYGFTASNIITLKDQQATRTAILQALGALASKATAHDVILFYYSGHGSQVFNPQSTEPDRRDETIVPADAILGAADIRDKELRRLFNAILDRGAQLTVVLDSCHSGSAGRGMPSGLPVRGVRPDSRAVIDGAGAGPRPEDRGAVILAAAQDFDLAWETLDAEGKMHGAFSWALARAMRDATPNETTIDTFLRAQARLRAERADQDPVLAAAPNDRVRPFLAGNNDAAPHHNAVAVRAVDGDRIVLQGGWINGITEGSELRSASDPSLELIVTALIGYGACEARLNGNPERLASKAVHSGDLFEMRTWAAPPSPPLRVALPATATALEPFVRQLKEIAVRTGVRWTEDPTSVSPTHLLRYRDAGWELVTDDRQRSRFSKETDAATIIAALPRNARLFVQVPLSGTTVSEIEHEHEESGGNITFVSDPDVADYVLAGRFAEDSVEYAWVRPGLAVDDARRSVLPLRTTWKTAAEDSGALFYDDLLRLARIHGWQTMDAPPDSAFPYVMAVRRLRDGAWVEDSLLHEGENYRLCLRARATPSPTVARRYVYAFLIDSWGRGILLYPASSVENRFPLDAAAPPSEIALPASFVASPPWGVDTYFLLSTDEPLPNPWVLEWNGVQTRTRDTASPLETLLSSVGQKRSGQRIKTRGWSLDRLIVESLPSH